MISAISRRLRDARRYRRAVSELNRLDDRILADIGIIRGDIKRVALSGR